MSEEQKIKLCDSVAELYSVEGCEVGGPLHIVLDDGNLDDESINFCLRTLAHHFSVINSLNSGCIMAICKEIAETLFSITLDERTELYELGWEVTS